jgi:hypothetical protein
VRRVFFFFRAIVLPRVVKRLMFRSLFDHRYPGYVGVDNARQIFENGVQSAATGAPPF